MPALGVPLAGVRAARRPGPGVAQPLHAPVDGIADRVPAEIEQTEPELDLRRTLLAAPRARDVRVQVVVHPHQVTLRITSGICSVMFT
ncbi:hypothetical protein [Streptomyces sp. CMB-StM0423]|uniref:hypothetical protein n=1 Tax=Streptomyces sp. CMB-StM0423 TaxID=2059884 RepID=UPI00131CCEA5|nr:hypothetical protein [Streptomyces sp. CMB-StM0423]